MRIEELISFTDDDLQGVEMPHDDPLVITTVINGYQVKRIMVDTGSSVGVLYTSAFNQMGIDKSHLLPCRGPLVGFTSHALIPEGMITLPFILGEYPRQITIQIQFLVMDLKSAHNVILGRIALHLLQAIPSTYHQIIKFLTPNGVGVARSNQREVRSCYLLSIKGKGVQDTMSIEKTYLQLEKTIEGPRTEPVEELHEVPIDQEGMKTIKIGSGLVEPLRGAMVEFLKANTDVFAWRPDDMLGVPPEIMCHELAVNKHVKPVRQKKRHLGPECQKAAVDEVNRLLKADFI
ncbi:uncharacterized protein LOC109827133 [Asparagus officinalis]|uniref:uncharacterized protein LOC109827133 n=1 Tax=Asparagus officinalis TaxID=4686 RepID=UPI00098E7611|nr:uncharacterized protein LOC109827133 [Asparagus officinalis]